MPAHHIGLLRYVKPSPSKPCRSDASLRPFFVMTKLAPIAIVEVMASPRPMYLSWLLSGCAVGRPRCRFQGMNILVLDHIEPLSDPRVAFFYNVICVLLPSVLVAATVSLSPDRSSADLSVMVRMMRSVTMSPEVRLNQAQSASYIATRGGPRTLWTIASSSWKPHRRTFGRSDIKSR